MFTKQAARTTSVCLCESDTTHERTERPPTLRPLTSIRSLVETHPHTYSPPTKPFPFPLPVDFLSPALFFFFAPFISSLGNEREDVSGVCVCVLVMFRLIQGQQQHKRGKPRHRQAGIGCFVHIC